MRQAGGQEGRWQGEGPTRAGIPVGSVEGVVDVVDDLAFKERAHRLLRVRHIGRLHGARNIAAAGVVALHRTAAGQAGRQVSMQRGARPTSRLAWSSGRRRTWCAVEGSCAAEPGPCCLVSDRSNEGQHPRSQHSNSLQLL